MTHEQSTHAHRVAVVGAGPAGIHASDAVICMPTPTNTADTAATAYFVDLFDAAPCPIGLIRFATQHREAGRAATELVPRLRLFGNITVGRDITLGELTRYYDTVIITGIVTGPDGDVTVMGTSVETAGVYELLRAEPSLSVRRTPVATSSVAADQPGAIVALLESRGIPFTTWTGWHRPAWADASAAPAESAAPAAKPQGLCSAESSTGLSTEAQVVVTIAQWTSLLASALAVPATP